MIKGGSLFKDQVDQFLVDDRNRKNWLFANTPKGAKASATIYSIVESAKENGLNPFNYLQHLFERLPNTRVRHYRGILSDNFEERSFNIKDIRTIQRKNKDGSIVRYIQLAQNQWDPRARCAKAKVLFNFGREEEVDREA